LSYGEQVKVLKPEKFKKEVKTILKEALGNYN
jgi:predicted DNA-binding transcriptional regulator YafY